MIKPNFFIVGAPKCGTTAMNDYLSQHPDIFMGKKELHYFGRDLKIKMKLTESEYLKNFQEGANKKIVGEASVWYLFSKTAAEEIKEFAPEAKLLIMLRNPVDVIYSLHSQHLYDGNEDIFDFETALSLDEERKRGRNLPDSVDYFELPSYKDSVLFSEQVRRYLDVFGRENVLIIVYDDFKADTEKTVSETLGFLGVKSTLRVDYHVINPNKRIKWFYLHRLLKNPPLRYKRLIRIILPFRKIRHLIMFYLFKWNIERRSRDDKTPKLRNKLKDLFRDDIDSLSKVIDRDLSGWLQ